MFDSICHPVMKDELLKNGEFIMFPKLVVFYTIAFIDS